MTVDFDVSGHYLKWVVFNLCCRSTVQSLQLDSHLALALIPRAPDRCLRVCSAVPTQEFDILKSVSVSRNHFFLNHVYIFLCFYCLLYSINRLPLMAESFHSGWCSVTEPHWRKGGQLNTLRRVLYCVYRKLYAYIGQTLLFCSYILNLNTLGEILSFATSVIRCFRLSGLAVVIYW